MFTVSVVVPSWHYWHDPLKLQPLWELYYATLIQERFPDFSVKIVDLREPDSRDPEYKISASDVYFYWIMKSADAYEIYEVVKKLRNTHPRGVHMAGGTHVDNHSEECVSVFDSVFQGSAEEQITQAFHDFQRGALEQLYKGESGHFEKYSHPLRSFLPKKRIVNNEHFSKYGGVPGTGVYFSRGCGFKCNFCIYNVPNRFEYKRPKQITQEIDYLKREYGVEGVNLRDEVCIPLSPKVGAAYLEAIGKGGVIWRGQTVTMGSEDMIRLAKESGCVELALGIESVDSDQVLKFANKPSTSIEKNRVFIETVKKHGIRVKLCFVIGLPGETESVLEKTIRFIEEVQPDYVAASGFDPVPGSTFFRNAEKYGIKNIETDLTKHVHLLYRFGDDEDGGIPFEYESESPWGRGLAKREILNNLRGVQKYVRDKGLFY